MEKILETRSKVLVFFVVFFFVPYQSKAAADEEAEKLTSNPRDSLKALAESVYYLSVSLVLTTSKVKNKATKPPLKRRRLS